MSLTQKPMMMAVCPNESFEVPQDMQECFWQIESGQEALGIMRMFHIDLLLVSLDLPDTDTWQFIKRVKSQNSKAKWALLCYQLDSKTEVQARTLGVLRIFNMKPDVSELYNLAVVIKQNSRYRQVLT